MTVMDATETRTDELLAREAGRVAHNYDPLEVVVATGSGAVLTDVDGTEYLDFLAAYSATNFGHRHPALLAAARQQLDRVTLTSRAFHHDQLAPFADGLTRLVGKDMMLPMNTGAEAVESGDQGGPCRGVPGQGGARLPRQDHRRGGQLPRPDHDHHQFLRPPAGP